MGDEIQEGCRSGACYGDFWRADKESQPFLGRRPRLVDGAFAEGEGCGELLAFAQDAHLHRFAGRVHHEEFEDLPGGGHGLAVGGENEVGRAQSGVP